MMNTLARKKLVYLFGLCLIPLLAFAQESQLPSAAATNAAVKKDIPTVPVTNTAMSREQWLQKVQETIAKPVCDGFMQDPAIANRLKEKNMGPSFCMSVIPQITQSCKNKFFNRIPKQINAEAANKWGHLLGECIGAEFSTQYLYK